MAASVLPADEAIFSDALAGGWENWSWDSTVGFAAASPVHSGNRSMSVQHTAGWGGAYLNDTSPAPAAQVASIRFWAHGGSSGTRLLTFAVYSAPGTIAGSQEIAVPANAWTPFEFTLAQLGSPSQVSGIVWQDRTGGAQSAYYIDDVALMSPSGPTPTPTPAPGTGPALSVDAEADRAPISPYIYGMNFASEELAADIALPVRRFGGNATTRYNWQNDTSNRAFDWYFENIPNDNDDPEALPHGSASDRFVEQDRRTGTETIITTPMIGWTPRDREFRGGFSVAKYGAQTSVDPWRPNFGNGIRSSDGQPITGNDPTDTSVAIGPQFTRDWMAHLASRFGAAGSGGVRFFALDNEPELWSSTHRDVRPQRLGYDELRSLTETYAAAIKAQDPAAQTLGPCSWGWTAYFYSDLDQAPGGAWWTNPLDRNAHGGVPLNDWYLARLREYEQANGVRLLDYFDLHYYPQAPGVSLSGAGSAATQELRLRSTRSLWDPAYTDESWIAEPVRLVPRMRQWVADNYPGTKTAMTEYNWGALDHINGAVAQADVLGIFGREGLDLATLWDPPAANQPGAFAFRIFRNYDGAGGKFGETRVRAASADQGRLAVYAALRAADGALTVVVVNKAFETLASTLSLAGYGAAPAAKVYRYSAANLSAIVPQPDAPTAGGIALAYPAQSITAIIIRAASPTPPPGDTWMAN